MSCAILLLISLLYYHAKRELSRKVKLLIYWSIYVPKLNYGHDLWVVTKRTRLHIHWRMRSDIRRELGVEPLFLCVERSQLWWSGHLTRIPPGHIQLK